MLTRLDQMEAWSGKNDRESAKAAARQRAESLKAKLDAVSKRLTELVGGAIPKDPSEYGKLLAEKKRLEDEYYREINTSIWGP